MLPRAARRALRRSQRLIRFGWQQGAGAGAQHGAGAGAGAQHGAGAGAGAQHGAGAGAGAQHGAGAGAGAQHGAGAGAGAQHGAGAGAGAQHGAGAGAGAQHGAGAGLQHFVLRRQEKSGLRAGLQQGVGAGWQQFERDLQLKIPASALFAEKTIVAATSASRMRFIGGLLVKNQLIASLQTDAVKMIVLRLLNSPRK